jgi:hypothetical protein
LVDVALAFQAEVVPTNPAFLTVCLNLLSLRFVESSSPLNQPELAVTGLMCEKGGLDQDQQISASMYPIGIVSRSSPFWRASSLMASRRRAKTSRSFPGTTFFQPSRKPSLMK